MLHFKWKALGIDDQSFSRFVGGDFFGHIPVFMKKASLITNTKVQMLGGLMSVRKEHIHPPG